MLLRMRYRPATLSAVLLAILVGSAAAGDKALERIRAVGREGAGNAEAAAAWREVVARGPGALPDVLRGIDGASAAAANWLRTAVDAIAERALARGGKLPVDALEQFIKETGHAPTARRLAYDWLCKADPATPDRMLPGLLHDPSAELRRDAVALAIKNARSLEDSGKKEAAIAAWRKALSGACDQDQVDDIVKKLDGLGVKTDVAAHFGFVRQWSLAASFDNAGARNFDTVYPPEKAVNLDAVYKGKDGTEVKWRPYTTIDPYGSVDLNKAIAKTKGAVAYAYAVVYSPSEREVELRVGSFNAIKVFINGKQVFARDEYHHGMALDQYVGRGVLKAGKNELLVKVCQNEQTEPWAQSWIFQLRICDAAGAAVPFSSSGEDFRREEGQR